MTFRIIQGDNRDTLKTLADNSIDAIVTDPPYGIDFLGKSWDANTGALETYQECLRVLKPGGHILAFSAARTYHHLAVTLEQAGFEIRDQIMWIYSSGFPKSQDVGRQLHKKAHGKPDKQRFDPSIMIKVSGDQYQHPDNGNIYRALPDINGDRLAVSHEGEKYGTVYEQVIIVDNEWSGWGTALKPAHEPIALARKPISEKNIAKNCQQWGTGAINIDAGRIPFEETNIAGMKRATGSTAETFKNFSPEQRNNKDKTKDMDHGLEEVVYEPNAQGRFPSNVIGEILQADYQKYFYCPKVSRRERHVGFEDPGPRHPGADGGGYQVHNVNDQVIVKGQGDNSGNNHPTVKPVELMKYLIKLITPPGGIVLDPFNGSGSTGCAAVELGFDYIGCELDPAYVKIAETRILAWQNKTVATNNYGNLFEE
jgi:site-specific DNA-methyltransferase (adenine-specific)